MTDRGDQARPDAAGAPRIAVIVPCHDAERYLADTLASVSAQTYAAWECVVVDDGSTDATAAVARRFVARDHRFRLLQQANGGVSAARNAGLDAVSPDVTLLAFLDSDDIWTPDALAFLVAAFEGESSESGTGTAGGGAVLGVYGTAEYMDASGVPVRRGAHVAVQSDRRTLGRFDLVDVAPTAPTTWSSLIVSGTIWPPGVGLFRRDAVERAGRFDPDQRAAEDWDLFVRMSRDGEFRPVHRHVVWYRQHADNLTRQAEAMAFAMQRTRWKIWGDARNTAVQHREAQRVWRRLQLRWIVKTGQAVADAVRARDRVTVREAGGALVVFTRQFLAGHPAEPDPHTARLFARYVAPRTAGRGSADS